VNATIGDTSSVIAAGDALVHAKAKNDVMAVTIAAAANTGASTGSAAAVGGTIDVIVTGNDVKAGVGDGSTLKSTGGKATVLAENKSDLILVSTSLAGANNGPAAGGTFAAIVSGNNTNAYVGNGATLEAAGDILVKSRSEENLINVLASVSAALESAAAAGTLGVLVTESDTLTTVGNGATIRSNNGSVNLLADGDVRQVVVQASVAASGGKAAVGAAVNVGVFDQKVAVNVHNAAKLFAEDLSEGKHVIVMANGRNQTILATVAGAATSGNAALTGTIPVVVSQSTIESTLGNSVKVEAGDTIVVAADMDAGLYNAAGALAASMGTAGVGATISTMVVQNKVLATVGDSAKMIAHAVLNTTGSTGGGFQLPNRSDKRRGIVISANANTRLLMASISGAAGSTAGASGVVNTRVYKNEIKAQA